LPVFVITYMLKVQSDPNKQLALKTDSYWVCFKESSILYVIKTITICLNVLILNDVNNAFAFN